MRRSINLAFNLVVTDMKWIHSGRIYLLFVLCDVEDFLEGEERFLKLLQPLRLGHLTPLEHLSHVFDVLRN